MIVKPCLNVRESGAEPSVPGYANRVKCIDEMEREA
ncbi:hypothetical protein SAMN05892877_12342 [Rhizobium subbaraonis]|uniref:Uncharacterized protein n=1 Tax=Rhizobium subbaraonis TaxID=908946 RepID=A0A285V0Q2_9HYPH|nr:hypothetical protein SAMN05892877_12342 [Rhizobium subbaraonis]